MSANDRRLALEQLGKGVQLHRAGQLGLAQSHYQRAVKLDPANSDALHLLGVVALQLGNSALAAKHLRACVKLRPAFAEAHNNLGVALRQSGRIDEAIASFGQALAARQGYVDAAFNLGIACEAAQDTLDAERAYRQALQWRPDHVDANVNLGNLLRREERLADALPLLEIAQRLAPTRAQTNGNLALLLSDLGRQAEAVKFATLALRLEPEQSLWWKALGIAQRLANDVENAIASLRRALAGDPQDSATALELALALNEGGETDAARTLLADAPSSGTIAARWRWVAALTLPAVYRDEDEIAAARARFAASVERLLARTDLDDAGADAAFQAAAAVAPFHLHYQPVDNTALQCRFGDLVAQVVARAAPDLTSVCPWRPCAHGGRVRVGFISSHLAQHTVSRYFASLIEALDPQRFDVRVWYGGGGSDGSTQRIAARVADFVSTQADARDLGRAVRAAELDVLVYPEIGMDPQHQVLAAMRLAPVQCALYGHPATSGAPNVDYFLSGERIEPPHADQHYRERLVCLPGIGARPPPPSAPGRGDWFDACANGSPLLLCLQSFPKLPPSFDDVLATIAVESGARIGFFTRNTALLQPLRARMQARFSSRGLDASRHLVFLPVQSYGDYLAGIARAPLVLDSPWFSGGGTSLDAFGVGTPVLAWEGPMARGRQTSAMLRMMGVDDLIATAADDYARKAIALCGDVSQREHLRARITARNNVLFADNGVESAFAEFVERAAHLRMPAVIA